LRPLATALIVSGLAGPLAASLFAEEPPVVVIALDTSKSIGKPGLDRAAEMALAILPELGPGAEAAVFTFDDQSRLVQARTSRPEDLSRALSGVSMSGRYTALYDALYDASRYLRDAPGTRKAIVLLTDGRDENSALKIEDGLKVAEDSHIPVYAVGVGQVDERVMRRIAKLTGGDYFPPGSGSATVIASRIAAGPGAADAAVTTPAPDQPAGRASAPPRETAPRPTGARSVLAPAAAPPMGSRKGWWVAVALALVAAVALAWIALGQRSRPRCATCRRPLPDRLSECAFCAREPATAPPSRARNPVAAKPTDRTVVVDTAPTIVARVGPGTEEYLEKTVVLRERPVLSVTRGPGMGLVYEVKSSAPTSLGRAKVNDIVLNEDVAVSSEHCRIRPEEGRFVLHDLKSTNGTFVNDRRVSRQPLTEGDTIQVGETYLQFRLEHRRS
jgi:FHA domain-containing protein/von Willebrand factor type A domain-containing protein